MWRWVAPPRWRIRLSLLAHGIPTPQGSSPPSSNKLLSEWKLRRAALATSPNHSAKSRWHYSLSVEQSQLNPYAGGRYKVSLFSLPSKFCLMEDILTLNTTWLGERCCKLQDDVNVKLQKGMQIKSSLCITSFINYLNRLFRTCGYLCNAIASVRLHRNNIFGAMYNHCTDRHGQYKLCHTNAHLCPSEITWFAAQFM